MDFQRVERGIDVGGVAEFRDGGRDVFFVDRLTIRRIEFLALGVLVIAEHKDDGAAFAGLQTQLDVIGGDRLPAISNRVIRLALFHSAWAIPAAPGPKEILPLGVEAFQLLGTGEEREVFAAFAVLGLVINDLVDDLDLAGGKIALEIGEVVERFPQAEFGRGE